METKFTDVCHHHLGCLVYIFPSDTITNGWLAEKLVKYPKLQFAIHFDVQSCNMVIKDGYLPILRPLSDITAEECQKYLSFYNDKNKYLSHDGAMMRVLYKDDTGFIGDFEDDEEVSTEYNPNGRLFWMLSKHFDVFGLIESGQAIDATTLNPNPYSV